MPMKSRIALVALLAGILFLETQPALAAAPTTESVPGFNLLPVEGGCGYTPTVTQRDPRTLSTWTDRRGATVLQTLRAATTTQYAGGAGGTMQLDENWLVTVTPNRDGTSTILFVGRGALWTEDEINAMADFLGAFRFGPEDVERFKRGGQRIGIK